MSEEKKTTLKIEKDSSKKQIKMALIVLAIFEAIVIVAFIINKLAR